MPLDIATGIASARHGSELLKTLRQALAGPEINHLEVANRLIEIQGLIMDAQAALIEAQEERSALKVKLDDRAARAEIEKSLTFRDTVYWRDTDGPFCPHCWDNGGSLVRLRDVGFFQGSRGIMFDCPNKDGLRYTVRLQRDPNIERDFQGEY
jgi:hypothetical protein